MKLLDTTNIRVPQLFLLSEPPVQSPEIVEAIDSVHRDLLQQMQIPPKVRESMIPALRGDITYFSFQNPDSFVPNAF